MKLPIAWLRDYVDLALSTAEIAERLAVLGFPVEEIVRRPKLSGVKIGRLESVAKHPNADRLLVCQVDVGPGERLTIATGADNVAEGQIVPVASIGAELAGLSIGPRSMRGIASQGMLCSPDELGLEPGWFDDGILQLEQGLPVGADFVETFHLNDDVLDVEITSNRVDAMCVLGIARELAASLGLVLREPDSSIPAIDEALCDARVTIESPDCKRFVAQRFSGARVATAPFWMRVRLALAGQRPIDNLVDISNFVMLEAAQPLHLYDFEKLAGGHLIARDAREGEVLRTLDGEERILAPRFLVIADEREPQGIAGLKGGVASEVSSQTRELLLESATFTGARIRRMSVALGLRTEASTRHEKGLPPALAVVAAARAAKLLHEQGARAGPAVATGEPLESRAPIGLGEADVRALLGVDVSAAAIERALQGLGFEVRRANEQAASGQQTSRSFAVTPPYWRGDVRIREDLVEEIARIVGYDTIPAEPPPVFPQHIASTAYDDERRTAQALLTLGYREAVNFSLQPASVAEVYASAGIAPRARPVEVRNPLSEDQRYLRFSLVPAMLAWAARYESAEALRLFEIGHVFEQGSEQPFETAMCAWMLVRPRPDEPPFRDSGFLEFKGDSLAVLRVVSGRDAQACSATHPELHPGKTASLLLDGVDAATIGAVDPRLIAAYGIRNAVYVALARMNDLPSYHMPRYTAPSKYPAIARDLALIVAPEIPAMDVEHAVRAGAEGVLAAVRVFDEYRGPQIEDGKKSVAVRVVLQRADRTLTDAEADTHVAAILESLRERVGAAIRR